MNSDSLPCGIRMQRPKSRSGFDFVPDNAEVKRLDRKMNGNNDGITVVTQSLIPSFAPYSAVFVSSIKTSMPKKAAMPVRILCFTFHHLARIYATAGKIITASSYAFEKEVVLWEINEASLSGW